MTKMLCGKVYYQLIGLNEKAADVYAGELREEKSGRFVFTYDTNYLANSLAKPIAYSMPLREEPFICEAGLHPFFDNLVAEGWLRNAQARALKVNLNNSFALLLGFGHDLPGAVSVVDPELEKITITSHEDALTQAVLKSRASLSGVQRKILVVADADGKNYRPINAGETSTHIAKLASDHLPYLIELEYLTTEAVRALLPDDATVELVIAPIQGVGEKALIVRRFDRSFSGVKQHFEEFNQLLGKRAGDSKYDGTYADMGNFMRANSGCVQTEVLHLLRRILVCLLVGNTDAHFKNFAMFHTRDGLRLTPNYDLVAAAFYKEYQTIALKVGHAQDLSLGKLLPKHLVALAGEFGVNGKMQQELLHDLAKRIPICEECIGKANVGTDELRNRLIQMVNKRWKGSFNSIGQLLSKRQ